MYFPFLPPNLLTCCCWHYSINVAITIVDVVVGFLFPLFCCCSRLFGLVKGVSTVCAIQIYVLVGNLNKIAIGKRVKKNPA